MDVHYKTFANRTNQDIRFDQMLHNKTLGVTMSSTSSYARPTITKSTSQAGLRKKVNVVSFNPGIDAQELVTKSPEKLCTATSHPNNPNCEPNCLGLGRPFLPICITSQTLTSVTVSNSHSVLPKTVRSTREHGLHIPRLTRDQTSINISQVTLSKIPNTVKGTHGKQANCETVTPTDSTVITRSSSRIGMKKQTLGQNDLFLASNIAKPNNVSTSLLATSTASDSVPSTRGQYFSPPSLVPKPSQSAIQNSVSYRKVNPLAAPSSDATKNQPRSFTSGSKRRAAYNIRPWQTDIDCEDVSPNKTLRPNQTSNRIETEDDPSLGDHTTLCLPSSPTRGGADNPSSFEPDPSTTPPTSSCSNHKDTGQFDFDAADDDGEYDEEVTLSSHQERLKNQSARPAKQHLPSTAGARHEKVASCDRQNVGNDDFEDEEEDDDVKPMFCPSNRRLSAIGGGGDLSLGKSKSFSHTRVEREEKPLFAVVRKVSDASVCQERGETQHLLDDVEYLIDGLADRNKVTTRTLSVLTLANKCLTASFRYLIQSHGLVRRICSNLHDAYTEHSLALTAAGLFYVLTRGRHLSVLDDQSLSTVLKLFSAPDGRPTSTVVSTGSLLGLPRTNSVGQNEAERVRLRVRQLIESLHQQRTGSSSSADVAVPVKKPLFSNSPSASALSSQPTGSSGNSCANNNMRHLQVNRQLTTSDLVMETILNLGTRKAPDWFKATLREGGGLDRVVDASIDAVDYLADLDPCKNNNNNNQFDGRRRRWWRASGVRLDAFALDRLRRVSHYTRLLENMTYMNSDNQTYLVNYRDQVLVYRLLRCLRVCASHVRCPRRSEAEPPDAAAAVAANSIQPDQSVLVDCILGIFRLLVNISHNEFASDRLGGCPALLETVFDCLLYLPHRMPTCKRFDLLVLTLCLLVNLCEHCPENRTRVVHMDLSVKPARHQNAAVDGNSSVSDSSSDSSDDDDDEEEENEKEKEDGNQGHRNRSVRSSVSVTTALDELIQLFLHREEQARNHEFERDDEPSGTSRREDGGGESPRDDNPTGRHVSGSSAEESTVAVANSSRPALAAPQPSGHVEEAGLKWRLIEDRRDPNFAGRGGGRMLGAFGGRGRSQRRSRRQHQLVKKKKIADGSSEDEDDEEEEEEDEEEEGLSEHEEEEEDDEDDDDDDSVGSGADVEFVADTQEEQEKLAKHMSQAQQHMEDSVVAAHAALLLGCILQSSRRYADRIREKLPGGKFRPLAIMLAKLLSFLSLTKGVGSSGSESIRRIVCILQAQDDVDNNNNNSGGGVGDSTLA